LDRLGLGGFLRTRPEWAHLAEENDGKFRTPTLRNVDKRPGKGFPKAFMHNGVFKSLEDGNFELDADAEAALVAFLKTLSDGYQAKPGRKR
jgi:cytochrome c peroxidase